MYVVTMAHTGGRLPFPLFVRARDIRSVAAGDAVYPLLEGRHPRVDAGVLLVGARDAPRHDADLGALVVGGAGEEGAARVTLRICNVNL